jgi:hypothetical protein
MNNNKKNKKRTLTDDSDSEIENRNIAVNAGVKGAWARFLVVSSKDTEKPMGQMSPFLLEKWFHGVSSTGFSIKKLRCGDLLVECQTKKASDLLRRRDDAVCVDRKISVSLHQQLNSSKGVIRCPDLKGISETDIQTELADQGVTRVQRVLVTKGSSKQPTNTLFLTCAMAQLPESIKVGYLRVKVTSFVPSPLRCFRCQKYGHGSKNCSSQEMCRDCGKAKHEGDCKDPKYCLNCEGKHSSSSRDCPKWKLEQEIQRVRTLEKCSFADARKRVVATQPNTLPQTFASAAASSAKPAEAPVATQLESLIVAIGKLTERLVNLETVVMSLLHKKPAVPSKPAQCTKGNNPLSLSSQSALSQQSNRTPAAKAATPHAAGKVAVPNAAPKAAASQSASGGPKPPGRRDSSDDGIRVGNIRVLASAVEGVLNNRNRFDILDDVDMTISTDYIASL